MHRHFWPYVSPRMSPMNGNDWICTYTGKKFFPLEPWASDVNILDIAHALSNTCRFTGHVRDFYSVAQHSVVVSMLCPENPMYGLLHDASEAYLCDVATPVKHSPAFAAYRDAEYGLQRIILMKYQIYDDEMPAEVKAADIFAGYIEGNALMPRAKGAFWMAEHGFDEYVVQSLVENFSPWAPIHAEREFLERFDKLAGGVQF